VPKEIYEWSDENLPNGFLPADGGMPEGMQRSAVNDSARERMATLRRYYDDPEWIRFSVRGPSPADAATFTRSGASQVQLFSPAGVDFTQWLQPGRIVRVLNGGGAGVHTIARVDSSSFDGNLTTTADLLGLLGESLNLDLASSGIDAHSITLLGSVGGAGVGSGGVGQFIVPPTLDAAGIQIAVDAAVAAGGGTILLAASEYLIDSEVVIPGGTWLRFLGLSGFSRLTQPDGTGLTTMFRITGTTGGTETFSNLIINAGNNASSCIRLEQAGSISVSGCRVLNGDVGISVAANAVGRVEVEGCEFDGYRIFGISTDSEVSIIQVGLVRGSRFFSGFTTNANAAAMKVSGTWLIDACFIREVGKVSGTPRGIWLWNETANNGGANCQIVGCSVSASNSQFGTAIEIGGDNAVVSGCRISSAPEGIGIHVTGTSAGQQVANATITGNIVDGGSPVVLNDRSGAYLVANNRIVASAGKSCITIDGDSGVVSGNFSQSGQVAIDILANANGNHIHGNRFREQSLAGVKIRGASSNNVLFDNLGDGLQSEVVDRTGFTGSAKVATTGKFMLGVASSYRGQPLANDYALFGPTGMGIFTELTVEQDIIRKLNIGAGVYDMYIEAGHSISEPPADSFAYVHSGPNGDTTDPIVWQAAIISSPGFFDLQVGPFVVVDDSHILTLSANTDVGGPQTFRVREVRVTRMSYD